MAEKDKVEQTSAGTIEVDPVSFSTTAEGVFAGGDAVSGPASVIEAIAAGKEAALSIDRYIRGVDIKEGRGERVESSGAPDIKFDTCERTDVNLLSPEDRINNFNEVELTITEEKAFKEAARCMNCGICSECMECEKVCGPGAVNHKMKDESAEIRTGAVIITSGIELYDADPKKEYGSDRYENVLTSIQFERLLSASGPTVGEVQRPSDGKRPKKIAFIQCVGSRDPSCGNEFCSSVCCMYSIEEAVIATEHDPEVEATVFYIDIRTFGKDFERYYETAVIEHGIKFTRCMVSKIYESPKTKNLFVKYIDDRGNMRESEFDMVVLAVGLTSASSLKPLAETLGIELNEYGFVKTRRNEPGLTSKEGIFVAGTCAEPKDINETVTDGSCAASLVSALLKDERGQMVSKKVYPPEKDVGNEDVRIGVFICRCGRNIASVVNVPEVVEYASKLKDVAFAGEFLYTCSEDSLDNIKKKIDEHDINRVVVASCTPHTHEGLFRDTVRQAGLNKYLFEMTSIREQVSWVHKELPVESTRKAKELVEMIVAKVRLAKPLDVELFEVVSKALVIGGGASGMQTALSIAEQGYDVYLVEKEERLGGHLVKLYENFGDEDPQLMLNSLIDKVESHERIEVMTSSRLESLSGFMGNYTSIIDFKGKKNRIDHGIIVVATGGAAYEPREKEYGWGQSSEVTTQVKLEEILVKRPDAFSEAKDIVMIQCVGSRNDEHPYCSRVCCSHAVKNAIKLKKINPEHRITVLYRDIRTYGFLERYYLEAREAGVIFLCFDKGKEPEVSVKNKKIEITHFDKHLNEAINLKCDSLVLSAGIVPGEDNEELSKLIKVPLNTDGFFMEAHAKIRPLDFTTEGVYLCGLAHSPRFLHESLIQAQGASVRAVTVMSKDKIESKAIIATVNERLCTGCGLCVPACPYDAREIDEDTGKAKVIEVLCQGCGACAVACHSGATTHKGFTKKQIMRMVEKV